MSTAQLSPGTVVDGRFTIGEPGWARPGAQSYAATDEQGQPVLLTAYVPECFPSGLVMERSLRELRQLQSVDSSQVASVVASGKLPGGGIYEVNAAISGRRLDDVVAQGAMSPASAAALMEKVGQGVLEAQKVGVIHRNLGPRVVFVDGESVVVSGFAVGEPHGGSSRGPQDTIAPEQIEGKVVDQRTLIYNLAALMHMLLTGAPLFDGAPQEQLAKHLEGTLPDDVHARLQRALGRDPRMRPMMLKQFIAELRAVGGGVGRAPSAPSAGGPTAPSLSGGSASGSGPSSRGWTMFMKAEEGDAPSTGAAAPAVAAEPAKPKTRGWTMFMEAAEDEPAPAKKEEPAAKPKTRGWTMFMEAEDGEEAAGPGGEASSEAASAPAVEEAPESKPKTRGWTMFMEAEEGADEAVAAAAPAVAAAAAPAVSAPAAPAVAAPAAPAVSAPAVSAPAVAAPPAAAPVVPSATGDAAPRSRGWTMFTETPSDGAPADEAAAQPTAPEVAASAPAEEGSSELDAPKKKRGWTVFMEKPIDDAKKESLGGTVPSTGESNAKGWTVFSPAATEAPEEGAGVAEAAAGAAEPSRGEVDEMIARGGTVVPSGAPVGPAGEGEAARPKTVVATHEPVVAPGMEGMEPRSRTVVAGEPSAVPGAMAGAAGGSVPQDTGAVSGPISGGMVPMDTGAVSGPISGMGPHSGAVSGPVSGPMSGPLPIPAEPREIVAKKGAPVGLIVGIVVVVAIGIAVAVVLSS